MKQGDIWLVDLDPTREAEIQKVRPVVIVNNNSLGKLPLKIIVPITDWKDRYEIASWMIRIQPNRQNGLTKESAADCFQIRSVSQDRFVKKIGSVSVSEMEDIREGLTQVLSS